MIWELMGNNGTGGTLDIRKYESVVDSTQERELIWNRA